MSTSVARVRAGNVATSRWILAGGLTVAILVAWQLVVTNTKVPPYILSPSRIAVGFWHELVHGALLGDVAATLSILLPGFVIGVGCGIVLGVFVGGWKPLEDVADSFMSVTYPLPKVTLFPLVVVWLGFSDSARIIVISLSLFYPAFVNSLAGTRAVEGRMLWLSRNMGVGQVETFVHIVLRASLPRILAGVRICVALGFVVVYAVEAIGVAKVGLGVLVDSSFIDLRYQSMYAGIVAFGLLGLGADQALRLIRARLLRGQDAGAGGAG